MGVRHIISPRLYSGLPIGPPSLRNINTLRKPNKVTIAASTLGSVKIALFL